MKLKRKLSRNKKKHHKQVKSDNHHAAKSYLLQQGISFFNAGQLVQAEKSLTQFLAGDPDHAQANHIYGLIVHKLQRSPEAISSITKAINLDPTNPIYHDHLGIILKDHGNFSGALKAFNNSLKVNPGNDSAYYNIAIIYFDTADFPNAIDACNKALQINKNHLGVMLLLAELYNIEKKDDSALDLCREIIEKKPDYPEAIHLLADMLAQRNQGEEAISTCKMLLEKFPGYSQGHSLLSLIKRADNENDDEILAMLEIYEQNNIAPFDKMHLAFALGKSYEDLRQYEKAFAYIDEGNKLARSAYSYDIRNNQNHIEELIGSFSEDFFSTHNSSGFMDKSPIFIVGMPRSGTSLVEQILASHPEVYGAGELTYLDHSLSNHIQRTNSGSYQQTFKLISDDNLAKIGSDYINRIRRVANGHTYITDKMPLNFLLIGLIRSALPQAKIIHCDRNPMATAWSIYKNQMKTNGYGFSCNLHELGEYFLSYQKLMSHWFKVLPGFIYNIKYEDLVNSPKDQIRGLLDFCGLDHNESCFSSHKNKRVVSTLSFNQANKPIYASSVELWRNYEDQLLPIKNILNISS